MDSLEHFGKEVSSYNIDVFLLLTLDIEELIPERRLEASEVEMCYPVLTRVSVRVSAQSLPLPTGSLRLWERNTDTSEV